MAYLRLLPRRLLPRSPYLELFARNSRSTFRHFQLPPRRLLSSFSVHRNDSDARDGLKNNRDLQQPETTEKPTTSSSEPGISSSDLELLSKLPPAPENRADVPSYAIVLTCKECGTRSAHKMTKQGYHHGTVLLTCPGCKNRHLMADHLKIFSDSRVTLDDILKEKGDKLKMYTVGSSGDDVELLENDLKS